MKVSSNAHVSAIKNNQNAGQKEITVSQNKTELKSLGNSYPKNYYTASFSGGSTACVVKAFESFSTRSPEKMAGVKKYILNLADNKNNIPRILDKLEGVVMGNHTDPVIDKMTKDSAVMMLPGITDKILDIPYRKRPEGWENKIGAILQTALENEIPTANKALKALKKVAPDKFHLNEP